MKIIQNIFFSKTTMGVLFVLFAVAMALATFIENDFGTNAARAVIYEAIWFESILVLGIINLIGTIIKSKLYRIKKFSIFLFHLSFIFIIIGAGITRYFGYEAEISIPEGEKTNQITSLENYIQITSKKVNETIIINGKLSELTPKAVNKKFTLGKNKGKINSIAFYSSAFPHPARTKDGIPTAVFKSPDNKTIYIQHGQYLEINNVGFSFQSIIKDKHTVKLFVKDSNICFSSPFEVNLLNKEITIPPDSIYVLNRNEEYIFKNIGLRFESLYPKAVLVPQRLEKKKQEYMSAVIADVRFNNIKRRVVLWGVKGKPGSSILVPFGNDTLQLTYGAVTSALPFKIYLHDFIIEKYPGSNSPSWFESKVEVIDHQKNKNFSYNIYMNHILKYSGYRFYQASYFNNEKGTVLSVNKDFWGTLITYFGYILMGLGMIISLFNRNSRFYFLVKESLKLAKLKKALIIIFMLLLSKSTFTQDNTHFNIDATHAKNFGKLLVQDKERIKPLNTLSSEILRKILRKTEYKGLNSDQVFLGIMAFPDEWKKESFIKIKHDKLKNITDSESKHVAFFSFFNDSLDKYILQDFIKEANIKKPSLKDKFDKEVIRADERVNIFYMVSTGMFLRIFPKANDPDKKWYSPVDAAHAFSNDSSEIFVKNIVKIYLAEVRNSAVSGNWEEPDKILGYFDTFQKKFGKEIMPSEKKVKLEILYNNSNVFDSLAKFFGIIGFILIILHFIHIFQPKLKLGLVFKIAYNFVLLGFIIHITGLAVRWNISGHAPWSNGYEALTYIACASIFAGLIFSRILPIVLSVSAIFAWIILHTAHYSFMDPEITSLVPVLQSYWLIIHVAVITASYAFLGIGALLGIFNLIVMFFETPEMKKRVDITIKLITNIIEITLTTGLYLLAIGTFLGGVWANESWGRYWGWDPKETWALITIVAYAFILHMRLIPGLKSRFAFNFAAILGFGFVIMTYFGVNYYLSGLHSYATGDKFPIPMGLYYTLASLFVIAFLAWMNQKKIKKT